MSRKLLEEEQAALLEILEPSGSPQWARVSDIDGWALRAAAKAIAHDLREPILGVRRLAGWLAELASDDEREESERYQRLLEARLERLEKRYDALRRFIEAGLVINEPEDVDLGALITEAVSRCAEKLGRPVDLEIVSCPRSMFTSRRLLARCIDELIANAIVHHDGERVRIAISVKRLAGAHRIEVADDGPGPGSDTERLFEPFVADGDHAGMGLAIVRRTAALRGGWCDLESRLPRGTCAVLTWPD